MIVLCWFEVHELFSANEDHQPETGLSYLFTKGKSYQVRDLPLGI